MTLKTMLHLQGFSMNDAEEERVLRHFRALERRLVHRPEPTAVLVLRRQSAQRQVEADLHVELGPLGPSLVSHQAAGTVDLAVRLAVVDVRRQLERRVAGQRGEQSFGVPSRREP